MAATIGFGEFSITVSTSWRPGGFGGLPNSVIVAPAMKVGRRRSARSPALCGSAIRALDAFENTAADGGAQRVHRRTVDRDDGDDITTLEFYDFVHETLPGYGRS